MADLSVFVIIVIIFLQFKRAYMKVLLINQNPVIKKLVGMASKKLNLEIENVARISNDFRAKDYICIIVDDENVGKNLERLTALQDQVKVCLLFARKTQIKKHEFNIAIQKPFLPTDILEILNDCIPKDGELKATDDGVSSEGIEDYDNISAINEIDMDLRSAEVTPPDGINIDTAKLQAEAEKIADEDTDDMLDFNPDSLDFSDLQAAGEVTSEATQDEVTLDQDNSTQIPQDADLDQVTQTQDSGESAEIKHTSEELEHRAGSIFDSDLSDLKPSSDNPLDLANFDLDSIVDSSALKAASLGIPAQIEEEAKEIVDNLGDDEDDLFLSDDERDLLQPSPKKFMQAKREEEELRAKELERQESQTDHDGDLEVKESLESDILGDILDDEVLKNVSDDSDRNDTTHLIDNDVDTNALESAAIKGDITQEDDEVESGSAIAESGVSNLIHNDEELADDTKLTDVSLDTQMINLAPQSHTDNSIDSIDLNALDETLSKQTTQDSVIANTLDDAFDDLTAALNSAFDNMMASDTPNSDTKDSQTNLDGLQELEDLDSKIQIEEQEENLGLQEAENNNSKDLNSQINANEDLALDLDLNPLETEIKAEDDILESLLDSDTIKETTENLAQENLDSMHNESQNQSSNDLDSKETNDLLLDSFDLDSINLADNTESNIHNDELSNETGIDSLLQLNEDLDTQLDEIQSSEDKALESTTTEQSSDILTDELDSSNSLSSDLDLETSLMDDVNDVDMIGSNQADMDLEAMLNIDDVPDTTRKIDSAKPQVLGEDTLTEVNRALQALNDDVDDVSQRDEEKSLADDTSVQEDINGEINLGNNTDELLTDVLHDNSMDSDVLDLQGDLDLNIDLNEGGQIDQEGDSNVLEDALGLDSKDENISNILEQQDRIPLDMQTMQNAQDEDADTLYVTLPSNEETLENLTETELAEALGENTDSTIVRLEPNQDNHVQETLSNSSLESSKEDLVVNVSDEQEEVKSSIDEKLIDDDLQSRNSSREKSEIRADNVKELDADSLIDFFKNTPKEKLHEIFDGSEINFSIHFGKGK